jgi:hypothetical protein
VSVGFVDIGGSVDHNYLNFLFIILNLRKLPIDFVSSIC